MPIKNYKEENMKLKKYFLFAVIMLLGIFTLASCGQDNGDLALQAADHIP